MIAIFPFIILYTLQWLIPRLLYVPGIHGNQNVPLARLACAHKVSLRHKGRQHHGPLRRSSLNAPLPSPAGTSYALPEIAAHTFPGLAGLSAPFGTLSRQVDRLWIDPQDVILLSRVALSLITRPCRANAYLLQQS